MKAGATAKMNIGGVAVVSIKNFLKAKIPVTASHRISTITGIVLFFTARIKSSPVKKTVTRKVIIIYAGIPESIVKCK